MSRSYTYSWDDGRSPLDRRPANDTLSPSSASGSPASYKPNVNRQKTKRWAEAKSVSYDGDDWGDGGDYDEYSQESHEPSRTAQPTGLRQPGQSLDSTPSTEPVGDSGVLPPGVGQGQRQYGSLPSQAPVSQQPGRSATNPIPAAINTDVGRPRANSFDEGDERRAFPQHQVPPVGAQPGERSYAPPTRFSQIGYGASSAIATSPGVTSPVSTPSPIDQRRPPSGVAQQGPPRPSSRTSSTSINSARGREYPNQPTNSAGLPRGDYQPTRDFSPPAVQNPVHSRGVSPGPVTHGTTPDTSHGGRFPPRKSSLSLQGPYNPTARASSAPPPGDGVLPGSQSRSSSISVGSGVPQANQEQPGSATDKPRPFIRPADIYKRMEEEREKERKSLDSARLSLDIATSQRASDYEATTTSPPVAGLRERLSSESLGRGVRARQSLESIDGAESGKKLRPSLDPVRERKSEYGFEALLANASKYEGDPPAPRGADGPLPPEAPELDHGPSVNTPSPAATSAEEIGSSPGVSLGPRLPDLTRFSGFGDVWLSAPSSESAPAVSDAKPTASQPEAIVGKLDVDSSSHLSHQPSVGFRSVVHHAFDRVDDKSVPPTPVLSTAGSQRSNSGDGVRRTDSASTSGISPILSRVPSSAAGTGKARESEGRESGTPAIAEEELLDSKRNSKTSIPPESQGQAVIRKPSPSPSPHNISTESLPLSFKIGHRRDLSTPSTSNSPKRSLVLEFNNQLPMGEEVKLATQPVGVGPERRVPSALERTLDGGGVGVDYAGGETGTVAVVSPTTDGEAAPHATSIRGAPESSISSKRDSFSKPPSVPPKDGDSRSGSRSPTKGKVRGLAEKFENSHQHPEFDRPRPTSGSRWSGENPETFRPVLSDSWVSASNLDDQQREVGSTAAGPDQSGSLGSQHSAEARSILRADVVKSEDVGFDPAVGGRPLLQSPQDQPFGGPSTDVSGGRTTEAPTTTVRLQEKVSSDPAEQAPTASSTFEGSQRGTLDRTPFITSASLEEPVGGHLSNQPIGLSTDQRSQPINTESLYSRSSIPPPPPPKDTRPTDDPSMVSPGYVAPIAPLKHKNIDQVGARDASSTSESFSRPPVLSSADVTPNDQQGDNLSKEIEETLSQGQSPGPISGNPTAPSTNTQGLGAARRISADSGIPEPRPESSYLPSVLDDYFAGGDDDNEYENSRVSTSQPQGLTGTNAERNEVRDAPASLDTGANEQIGALAPASIQKAERARVVHTVPGHPTLLRNRFSWETYDGEVDPAAAASSAPYRGANASPAHGGQGPQRDQSFSSVTTPDPELRQLMGTRSAYLDGTGPPESRQQKYTAYSPTSSPVDKSQGFSSTTPIRPSPVAGIAPALENIPHQAGELQHVERLAASPGESTVKGHEKPNDRPTTSDLEVVGANVGDERGTSPALAGATVTEADAAGLLVRHQPEGRKLATPEPVPGQTSRPSTTQSSVGKEYVAGSELAPNTGHRPSYHSATGTPGAAESSGFVSRQPSQEVVAPMPPQPTSIQAKFPTFREILALKSPAERIKTYNETREQFATMNSGLAHWISVASSRNPGLAGLVSQESLPQSSASGHGSTPPRSVFHKQTPSGPAPPLQEPYYKQYMQFSSTTASPTAYSGSAPRPPTTIPPSVQGFLPPEGSGGAKPSNQPTQHKRMELLHSIGGKAGGAAKGLFAKGRSKLKGDKASNTPSSLQPSPASSRSVQLPPELPQQRQRPASTRLSPPPSPSSRGSGPTTLRAHGVGGGGVGTQGHALRPQAFPQHVANQHLANADQSGRSPQQQSQAPKLGFRLFGGAKKQNSPRQLVVHPTLGVMAPQPQPQPQLQVQERGVDHDLRKSQQHMGDRTGPSPSRDVSYLHDRSSSDTAAQASPSDTPPHEYPAPRALPPHLTAYPASVDGGRSAATESPVLGSDPVYHGQRPAQPESALTPQSTAAGERDGSPVHDGDSGTRGHVAPVVHEQSAVHQPHHSEALALPGASATSRDVSPMPPLIRGTQHMEGVSKRPVSMVSRDVSPVRSVVEGVGDGLASESLHSQQPETGEEEERREEVGGFVGLPPVRRSSTFDLDIVASRGGGEIEADVGTSQDAGERGGERSGELVDRPIADVGTGLAETGRQGKGVCDDDVSSVQLESETEPGLATKPQQPTTLESDLTPKIESLAFPHHEEQRSLNPAVASPQGSHQVQQDVSRQATPITPVSRQRQADGTSPLQPTPVPSPEQQHASAETHRGSPESFTVPPQHLVDERLSLQRQPGNTLPPLQTTPVLPSEQRQEPTGDRRPHRTFTLPAPQSPIDQRLSLTTTPPRHISPTTYGHEREYRGPVPDPRDPRSGFPRQFMAPGQHPSNAPLLRGPPGQDQGPTQYQPFRFSGPPSAQQPGVLGHPVGRPGPPNDGSAQFYPRQLPPSESLYARQQGTEYQLRGVGPPGPANTNQSSPLKPKRGSGFLKSLSLSSKPEKPSQTQPVAGPSPPALSLSTLTERSSRVSISTTGSHTEQQEKKRKRASIFGTLTKGSSSGDQRQQQQQQEQHRQQQHQQPQQQQLQRQQQQQYQEPPQTQQQSPPARERMSWYSLGPSHRVSQQNAGNHPPTIGPEPAHPSLAVVSPPTRESSHLVHSGSGPPLLSGGPLVPDPAPFPPRESPLPGRPAPDLHFGGPHAPSTAPSHPQTRGPPYLHSASDTPRVGGPAPSHGLGASVPSGTPGLTSPPARGPPRLIHPLSEPLRPSASGSEMPRFVGPLSGPPRPGPSHPTSDRRSPFPPSLGHSVPNFQSQGLPSPSVDTKGTKPRSKLTRSGTASAALDSGTGGKKRGFSGLSSIFSRSGTTGHKHSASTTALTQPPLAQSLQPLGNTRPPMHPRVSPGPLHPVNETRGQLPPLEGYYAPQNVRGNPLLAQQAQFTQPRPPSPRSPEEPRFIGGRRLDQQQVASAKHALESDRGFRGPYHPPASPGSPSAGTHDPESPATGGRGSISAQPLRQPAREEPKPSPPLHLIEPQYETQPIPEPYGPSSPTAVTPAFIPILYPPGFDPAQFPQGAPGHYVYIPHPIDPSGVGPHLQQQFAVPQSLAGPPRGVPFTITSPISITSNAMQQRSDPNSGSTLPPVMAQQQNTSSPPHTTSTVMTQQQAHPTNSSPPTMRQQPHLPPLDVDPTRPISANAEARSPPKEHPGQQTPWALSIPGESAEDPPSRSLTPLHQPTPSNSQHSYSLPVQQGGETTRNEEAVRSPASIPLPDSRLASPLSQTPTPSGAITPTPPATTPPSISSPPLPPKIPHSTPPPNPAPQRSNTQKSLVSNLSLSPPQPPPPQPTTLRRAPSSAAELEDTEPDAHLARRRVQDEKLLGFDSGGPRVGRGGIEEEDEDKVVMTSTAYPGQEWAPEGYGRWEGD